MKELRFSIQCGASNRKALIARRCSQCAMDNDEHELNEISQQNQLLPYPPSNRSSSSLSVNLQAPKHRSTQDRTSDTDKFDTLLMLAADRTNYLDTRRKNHTPDSHQNHRKHRHSSQSSQRKDIPLVLIEQQAANHEPNPRSQQVRFSTNAGSLHNRPICSKKKTEIHLSL